MSNEVCINPTLREERQTLPPLCALTKFSMYNYVDFESTEHKWQTRHLLQKEEGNVHNIMQYSSIDKTDLCDTFSEAYFFVKRKCVSYWHVLMMTLI
jgi:hypothetical protein